MYSHGFGRLVAIPVSSILIIGYIMRPFLPIVLFCFATTTAMAAPPSQTVDPMATLNPTAFGKSIGTSISSNPASGTGAADTNKYLGGGDANTVTGAVPGSDVMGVTSQKTVTAKLRCGGDSSAAGLMIRGSNCAYSATGIITSIQLSGCDRGLLGGQCNNTDYANPQQANVGQTAAFGEFSVTVNSCTNLQCVLTVVQNTQTAHAGSNLNNAAANAAATSDDNTAVGSIRTAYLSPEYNTQMTGTGSQYGGCVSGVQSGINSSGTVSSCDGASQAYVGTDASATACTVAQQCVAFATSHTSWTESCDNSLYHVTKLCDVEMSAPVCTQRGGKLLDKCKVKQVPYLTISGATHSPTDTVSDGCTTIAADPYWAYTSSVCLDNAPRNVTPTNCPSCSVPVSRCWNERSTYTQAVPPVAVPPSTVAPPAATTTCNRTVSVSLFTTFREVTPHDPGCDPMENDPPDPYVDQVNGFNDDGWSLDFSNLHYGFTQYVKEGEVCLEGASTKWMTPSDCSGCSSQGVFRSCWQTEKEFSRYYSLDANECATWTQAHDLSKCVNPVTTCKEMRNGVCLGWNVTYDCLINATCVLEGPLPFEATLGACPVTRNTCTETDAVTSVVTSSDPTLGEYDISGKCLKRQVQQICYATSPHEPCLVSSACKNPSEVCLTADPQSGLCSTIQRQFSCGEDKQYCTKYAEVSCNAGMTKGLNEQAEVPAKDFENAVATMGLANEIAKSAASGEIEIFKGLPQKCIKGAGIAKLVYPNCCKTSITKRTAGLLGDCGDPDIELAAARRAERTVFKGTYCAKKKRFIGCIKTAESYCVFPSLLSRLINVQGRDQLNQLASAGAAGATTSPAVNFDYYNTANSESWQSIGNGVLAMRWPAYCRSPDLYQAAIIAGAATGDECPGNLAVTLAACITPECASMGTPPAHHLTNSGGWTFATDNPMTAIPTTMSKFAVASGTCSPQTEICTYKVSAWSDPGGLAWVKTVANFPLYSGVGAGQYPSRPSQLVNYDITPVPHSGSSATTMPATVSVGWKLYDNWSAKTVLASGSGNIPTLVTPDNMANVDAAGKIKAYGGCVASSGYCEYTFLTQVVPSAVPAGNAKNPNCAGFSTSQLAMLDFNKMDFSEWINTIKPQLSTGPNTAALSAKVATDQSNFFNTYQSNGTSQVDASPPPSIRVSPLELTETGSKQVTVRVVRNWPRVFATPAENVDPINTVFVNWGDGSPIEMLTLLNGEYIASHFYNDFPPATVGGSNNRFNLTATVNTSQSGTKTLTEYVTLTWITPGERLAAEPSDGSDAKNAYQLGIDPVTGTNTNTIKGVSSY